MDRLPLLLTPGDAERLIARRLRALRAHRGLTQVELAERAGLGVATVARMESTGKGQVATLLALTSALGRLGDVEGLLAPPAPTTLDELEP